MAKDDVLVAKSDQDYLTRIPEEEIPDTITNVAVINLKDLHIIAKVSAHSFVCSSFIKSLRESPYYSELPEEAFFASANAVINYYIDAYDVILLVDQKNAEYFYGYTILNRDLANNKVEVVYVYIKHLYRKQGLMRALMGKYLKRDYYVTYRYTSRTLVKILSRIHTNFKTIQERMLSYTGF
jgi:GNAT superfamily N-acetyltransferase